MFEGTIIPAVVDRPAEGSALRVPCWEEIVMRLAAADEVRHAMTAAGDHPAGNFERFGERTGGAGRQKQRLVNLNNLTHGKDPGGKILPPQRAR
ncbi:hypothetical protein [Pelagerythrobacter aerophilus]